MLKKRRWAKAERFLREVEKEHDEDEWRTGYTHALEGMISALRVNHSSLEPYILKLEEYDSEQLKQAEKQFNKQSKTPSNTEFDRGYFQAWADYIHYRLHKRGQPKRERKR